MSENKNKPTAVVVNDDTTQLGILSGLARKAGLDPLPFTGAEAALAAMDPETPPDIIVTDLYMPGLDGWRFCRLLRSPEYAFCNEIPILVVSATFAGDSPERIAADIGADIFLPSPVDGKEFVAHVKALLSGKEARRLPRALIVEDSKSLAGLLKKAFAAHGYAADTALSVSEAEAAFGKTAHDVAVLDYHLPDGTGDSLLDAFRARRPDCVCVMMTTDPTSELALDWMKRGAAAYLRKPFEPEFLIELCARARRERALLRAEDLLEARTQELRASEERYRDVAHATSGVIWETDAQFTITRLSGRVYETFGYEAVEIIGRNPVFLIDPEERERIGAIMTGLSQAQKPARDIDYWCRNKDGGRIRIQTSGLPFFDKDGSLLGYRGTHLDMTEMYWANWRKSLILRIQGMSGESDTAVSALLCEACAEMTESPMAFFGLVEPDESAMTAHVWSPRAMVACRMPEKPERFPIETAGIWADPVRLRKPVIVNDYASAPNKGGLPDDHVPISRYIGIPLIEDGKVIAIAAAANRTAEYDERDVERLLLILTDIAKYLSIKQKDKILKESMALLKRSQQIAHLGSWKLDVPANRLDWSDEVYRIFGCEPQEFGATYEAFLSFVHPDDRDMVNDAYTRSLQEKRDRYEIEHRIVRKATGEVRFVHERCIHEFDDAGAVIRSIGMVQDITGRKRAEKALKESESSVRNRLKAVLEPQGDWGDLELSDIIDVPAVQSLMENFHRITGMASAVVDDKGKVLVGVGWQDICTRFHRIHPETARHCLESDTILARGATPGTFKTYCCKNGMWDMASPIVVSGRHMGNIYFGQFLYADEAPDEERFRDQARRYGFDEEAYIAALGRIPRYSRETVSEVMAFYSRLGETISSLSFSTVSLARTITTQKQAEEALRESEEKHRALVAGLPDTVMRFDREGRHLFVSDNVRETVDMEAAQFIGKTHAELGFPEEQCRFWEDAIRQVFDSGAPFETEFAFDGKAGPVIFNWRLIPERDSQGAVSSLLSISRDITAHRKAEQEYRTLFSKMLDGFALHEIILDTAGTPVDCRFLAVNPAFERMTGLKAGDIAGRTVPDVLPGIERHWIETYGKVALTGEPVQFMNHNADLGKYFEVTAFRPAPGQFACIFQDITARKLAEEEKEKLQSQLNQAQKMESVGRLAGGVAHDFNNMLGVILGHAELALERVDPGQPLFADLLEVRKAAERSADLTRQLLTFGRKQTVAPKVLDFNETVEGMLKLLRRLIGEDIDLAWLPGGNLAPVRMDPSQLDQILANLCVNARDAIADVGKITIETGAAAFDEAYCAEHAGFVPGEYVLLAVSDNGCGMDQQTLANIFEPFFTTKELGRGTGLGLASVYGAVKQNDGFINVYSEPGQGTTFKIYLPRHAARTDRPAENGSEEPVTRGHETVLLVEDEPAILRMATMMLEREGYTVIAAGTPGEAIRLAREYAGEIHLLMTDVVMPEMNGRDLARNLMSIYPGIKRLFMSGYTANVIAHHGVLDEGVHFIQKPFSVKGLAVKVREVLHRE